MVVQAFDTAKLTNSDFDVRNIRRDFPILEERINGRPLAYLDNSASSQRPQAVIDAIDLYYRESHANVHRGVHTLSQRATEAFEGARDKVRRFINARSTREIIFVRGTTEAINLVAQSFGRSRMERGDEIVLTWLEHHANIVPWQMLAGELGVVLKVVPIDARGMIDVDDYQRLLGPRTKLVAFAHVSNALGTVLPVEQMIALARTRGIPSLVDGAQAIPHLKVDVQALDCDFYAFSGHKMFGPTGIGVLYGREALLEAMPPWQGGGDMILTVSFTGTTYNALPYKFEAGTPNIADAIGLGAAIDYLGRLDWAAVTRYEDELLAHATRRVSSVPGVRLIGTADRKVSVLSFVMDGIHPHDLGTILDADGIAVRTGHHCAMPVMEYFQVPATARASFAFYNTFEEAERLVTALGRAREVFR
ncbi:MAG TPA: cysteine desulfurase [Steroidobacteraceae bacterium]|nr:cysteine desulfurase [Steroidobacteraceae bacterium]